MNWLEEGSQNLIEAQIRSLKIYTVNVFYFYRTAHMQQIRHEWPVQYINFPNCEQHLY